MEKFMTVDVNLFAIILCLLILLDANDKTEKKVKQNKLFVLMLAITILLAVVDSCAWLFYGDKTITGIVLNYFFNYCLYMLNPLTSFLWVLYARYQIGLKKSKKVLNAMLIPYGIYILLLGLNTLTKAFFYVDENGFYHRGQYYWYTLFFIYDYVVYAYYLLIKNKNKMDKRTLFALSVFPLPPSIAGFLQSLFFGTLIVCPGLLISIVILYINIQNKRINTDYLTGVFNRREADGFIQNKINAGAEGFSAIILDIDKFKEINDRLGHQTGDDALEAVAKIIKATLRSNDFVARYGGDEFLIVLNIGEKKLLELAVKRIRTAVRNYNHKHHKPYILSLSMGYDVYDSLSNMNEDQYIKHIDALMYKEKNNKQHFSPVTA